MLRRLHHLARVAAIYAAMLAALAVALVVLSHIFQHQPDPYKNGYYPGHNVPKFFASSHRAGEPVKDWHIVCVSFHPLTALKPVQPCINNTVYANGPVKVTYQIVGAFDVNPTTTGKAVLQLNEYVAPRFVSGKFVSGQQISPDPGYPPTGPHTFDLNLTRTTHVIVELVPETGGKALRTWSFTTKVVKT